MRSRPTAESLATFKTSSEGVRIGPFPVRQVEPILHLVSVRQNVGDLLYFLLDPLDVQL